MTTNKTGLNFDFFVSPKPNWTTLVDDKFGRIGVSGEVKTRRSQPRKPPVIIDPPRQNIQTTPTTHNVGQASIANNPDLSRLAATQSQALENLRIFEESFHDAQKIFKDLQNPDIPVGDIKSRLRILPQLSILTSYVAEALALRSHDPDLLLNNPYLLLRIEDQQGLCPIEQLIKQLESRIEKQRAILELAQLESFAINSMLNANTLSQSQSLQISNQAIAMFQSLSTSSKNAICYKIWYHAGKPTTHNFGENKILEARNPAIFHEFENHKIIANIIQDLQGQSLASISFEQPFLVHQEMILDTDTPSIRLSLSQLYQLNSFWNLISNPDTAQNKVLHSNRFSQLQPALQQVFRNIIQIGINQNELEQDISDLNFSLLLTTHDLSGRPLIDTYSQGLVEKIHVQRDSSKFERLYLVLTAQPPSSNEKILEEFYSLDDSIQQWLKWRVWDINGKPNGNDWGGNAIRNNPRLLLPVLNQEIKKINFSIENALIRPWLDLQKTWAAKGRLFTPSVADPIETLRFSSTAVKTALTAQPHLARNSTLSQNYQEVFYSDRNIDPIRNDQRVQNLSRKVASLLPHFTDPRSASTLAQYNITSVQWGLFQDTSLPEWNFRIVQSHLGSLETRQQYQSYGDLLQAIIQKENLQIDLPQACIIPTQMRNDQHTQNKISEITSLLAVLQQQNASHQQMMSALKQLDPHLLNRLKGQLWYENGGKSNPNFGGLNWGDNAVQSDPRCLIPILETEIENLRNPAFFLMLDKKAEETDFSTGFSKLNLDQQQRCARDLCRFIALTGYQIPSINEMSIVDGKIKLHHLGLRSPDTIQHAQENALHSLKRLIEDYQFCGHWNGERFPVLRIAAEQQLTMLKEKELDSLDAIKGYRHFLKIMKDPASIKEEKEIAFQRLPEQMRYFLHYCVYSGLKQMDSAEYQFIGTKRLEADINILTQLTNQKGMDILEQIEVRYSLTETLNILEWIKRYLKEEKIQPELLFILFDTLHKTFLGSALLAPIAHHLMQKVEAIHTQHADLSDQELVELVCKALAGDRGEDGILDIYIRAIDAAKREVSIPAIKKRVELNREFDPKHFPVRPKDKQQIQVSAAAQSQELMPQQMRVLTVAYECAQYGVKHGGLGEAIYGTAKALKDKGCAVTILMPKLSNLPQPQALKIQQEGQESTIAHFINGQRKEVKVKTIEQDGMTLAYMEDPDLERNHFAIESGIYQDGNLATERPWHGLKERMAYFGSATAEYVVAHQDEFDAVIYNDWHSAYAIDRIAHRYFSDWVCGKFPANIMAIHNGSFGCQGVFEIPDADILNQFGDQRPGLNIMEEALQLAERSVAVSESYAQELQYGPLSAGIGPWMRKAAAEGRLKGIVNGSNPDLWDPNTNTTLKNWKDPQTAEPIDLSYSPETSDLVAHKAKVRTQLFKALQTYYPEALNALGYTSAEDMINNPILLYVGRYDQSQKGIDKLVQIMEAANQRDARFIAMGTGEMNGAPEILDRLSQRADELKCGWVTRGIDDASLKMQKGDPERGIPALGPLIRAAADFYCVPSSFEPCGLVQTEGWLYGALAIGTSTGGLADTIINDQQNPRFNGFTFERLYNWESEEQNELIRNTTLQALDYWTSLDTASQNQMMARLMRDGKQLSWTTSPNGISPSEKYLILLKEAINAKKARHTQTTDLLGIEDAKAPCRDNYFGQGLQTDLYRTFGAHVQHGGGVNFRVMAPAAQEVKLVTIQRDGSENPSGKETFHKMTLHSDGSWQAHLRDAGVGTLYQYEILNAQGQLVRKADPFSFGFEAKDRKISEVTAPIDSFVWTDEEWIQERQMRKENAPINIYEVYVPSWFKPNDKFISYPEIARRLVVHCHEMGFNYVELFGIFEHLLDESMGYQVSGFFAPTSRNGTLQEFQEFVNILHENGIAVIADFIPAHFVKDDCFLGNFDGTHFFENHDRYNRNSTWGTHTFNFEREDVRNFLLSSARFFIDECHIDGLRVDAVAHFIAYSRWREGAPWNPGQDGSEWNRAGVEFTRQMNRLAHDRNVLTISENSWVNGYTDTLSIDHPSGRGLGFDLRFNMDARTGTFDYFRMSQIKKQQDKDELLKKLTENSDQNFIGSYICHDEIKIADPYGHISEQVKHTEDSEDDIEKKIQLFYALNAFGPQHARMMVMGTEFGLAGKWDPTKDPGWDRFNQAKHQRFKQHCAQVNRFYLDNPVLWNAGPNLSQFNWVNLWTGAPIIAYERIDRSNPDHRYLVIHNFSKTRFENYTIRAREQEAIGRIKHAQIAFRSDRDSDQDLGALNIREYEAIDVALPEYGTVVIEEFC